MARVNPSNAEVPPTSGFMLEGGAEDLDAAWEWFLCRASYGDIVIICATCTTEYNPYVPTIHAMDSVQTLKITKRRATTDPFVTRRSYVGLFMRSSLIDIGAEQPLEPTPRITYGQMHGEVFTGRADRDARHQVGGSFARVGATWHGWTFTSVKEGPCRSAVTPWPRACSVRWWVRWTS